jgi:hypothetical protein
LISLLQVKKSGLTEGLAFTFRQLNKGGGPSKMQERFKEEFQNRYGEGLSDEELRAAAREEMVTRMQAQLAEEGIDVNGVTGVMEEMSKRNRELFKLPPYVLYVSRAFSTLEGIGLSVNNDYSILQQCYPYLSKRLLSDNSPRSKNALKLMLFGGSNSPEKAANAGGMFSPAKLMEMGDGFASYTTAVSTADTTAGAKEATSAIADVILDPNGNYLQELLLEEAAKITDAAIRDRFQKLKDSTPGRLVKTALKTPRDLVFRFVPEVLRPLALPVTLPYDVASMLVKAAGKNADDEASLQTIGSLWDSARPQLRAAMMQNLGVPETNAPSNTPPAMAMKGKAPTVAALPTATQRNQNQNSQLIAAAPRAIGDAVRQLQQQVSDPQSALRLASQDPKLREQLPVVGTLGRRFGAILLERAADRFRVEALRVGGTAGLDDVFQTLGGSTIVPSVSINQNMNIQQSSGVSNAASSGRVGRSPEQLVVERLLTITATAVSTVAKAVLPTVASVNSEESTL